MDGMLVAFQAAFFVPVFVRMVNRSMSAGAGKAGFLVEIATGARTPALVLHGTGLVLVLRRGRSYPWFRVSWAE